MPHARRIAPIALAFVTLLGPSANAQNPAPAPAAPAAAAPSPELVGRLTQRLSITPEQAIGGAGAIFGLAKTRLSPEDFGKVAGAVPGMDSLLKAAPAPEDPAAAALGSLGSALPGGAVPTTALPANVGGLASLAGPFKSLGLSPDMAVKMVPILTRFVTRSGGADVGSLLTGALK